MYNMLHNEIREMLNNLQPAGKYLISHAMFLESYDYKHVADNTDNIICILSSVSQILLNYFVFLGLHKIFKIFGREQTLKTFVHHDVLIMHWL
jgi:hypothetical protein